MSADRAKRRETRKQGLLDGQEEVDMEDLRNGLEDFGSKIKDDAILMKRMGS